MIKNKLLIVGAFPSDNKKIYGGILNSCKIILNSILVEKFDILTIDSSQLSNPPPNIFIRFFFAIKRINSLICKIVFRKPNVALIFTSDGLSAIEKGLMCLICSFFKCKVMIFPRAGNLITQTKDSRLMKVLIKFLFSKASIFLCQGIYWKDFAIDQIGFDSSNVKIINNWTATQNHIQIGEKRDYKKINTTQNMLFVGWQAL